MELNGPAASSYRHHLFAELSEFRNLVSRMRVMRFHVKANRDDMYLALVNLGITLECAEFDPCLYYVHLDGPYMRPKYERLTMVLDQDDRRMEQQGERVSNLNDARVSFSRLISELHGLLIDPRVEMLQYRDIWRGDAFLNQHNLELRDVPGRE